MITEQTLTSMTEAIEETAGSLKLASAKYSSNSHEVPSLIERLERLLVINAGMVKLNEQINNTRNALGGEAALNAMSNEDIVEYVLNADELAALMYQALGGHQEGAERIDDGHPND